MATDDRNNNYLDSARSFGSKGLHAGFRELGGFQKFILRGNVIDLAVGIVIGAAFNNVVQAFVADIIQPLLGKFGGLGSLDKGVWNGFTYGHLIGVIITFLIDAAIVYFLVVRPINALRDRFTPHKDIAPTTRDCPFCLSSVPLGATRCAYCTAQLPPADQPGVQAQTVRG